MAVEYVVLNNGVKMPALGSQGIWQCSGYGKVRVGCHRDWIPPDRYGSGLWK